MYIGQTNVAPCISEGQFLVIQSHLVKDSRPEIIDRRLVLRDMITEFIGGTINGSPLDSSPATQTENPVGL